MTYHDKMLNKTLIDHISFYISPYYYSGDLVNEWHWRCVMSKHGYPVEQTNKKVPEQEWVQCDKVRRPVKFTKVASHV